MDHQARAADAAAHARQAEATAAVASTTGISLSALLSSLWPRCSLFSGGDAPFFPESGRTSLHKHQNYVYAHHICLHTNGVAAGVVVRYASSQSRPLSQGLALLLLPPLGWLLLLLLLLPSRTRSGRTQISRFLLHLQWDMKRTATCC
jgi:hypothetical protein